MKGINLRKNIHIYFLSSILVTISYSLPHSILTVLFIAKGISLSQILMIQSAYSLAVMLFEFPSGVIADIFSKKDMYLISKSLLIILYIIIIYSNSFWLLYLAWFIYGIATAFDSGTIDADLVNQIKESKNIELSSFIATDSRLSILSLLIGSTTGSIFYLYFGTGIYFLSILFCMLAIIITFFFFQESTIQKEVKNPRINDFKKHILKGFKELKNSNMMRFVIILEFLTQIFFQTHFQLWQAFLIEKDIPSTLFSLFYILFQVVALISYSIDSHKITALAKFKLYSIPLGFLPLVFLSNKPYIYIPVYILYVFLFYIIQFILKKYYTQIVAKDTISSLISFKATISRLGSMITLFLLSIFANFIPASSLIISSFIFTFFSLTLGIAIFMKKYNSYTN